MPPGPLIIIDWDDTLFPTSWTVKKGIKLALAEDRNKFMIRFSRLDMLLHKLLTLCLKFGRVVIVTNAMTKWIDISTKILPNTGRLIREKIKVISAREKYQDKYPSDIYKWKQLVFQRLMVEHYPSLTSNVQNIISIGDAEYELEALIKLANPRRTQYLKSIKFIRIPTYDMLIDQLEVLLKSIQMVVRRRQHMDLRYSEKDLK